MPNDLSNREAFEQEDISFEGTVINISSEVIGLNVSNVMNKRSGEKKPIIGTSAPPKQSSEGEVDNISLSNVSTEIRMSVEEDKRQLTIQSRSLNLYGKQHSMPRISRRV